MHAQNEILARAEALAFPHCLMGGSIALFDEGSWRRQIATAPPAWLAELDGQLRNLEALAERDANIEAAAEDEAAAKARSGEAASVLAREANAEANHIGRERESPAGIARRTLEVLERLADRLDSDAKR